MYHRVHTCMRLCVVRVYVCNASVCVRSCTSSGVVLRAKRYGRTVTETRTAHRTHCSWGLSTSLRLFLQSPHSLVHPRSRSSNSSGSLANGSLGSSRFVPRRLASSRLSIRSGINTARDIEYCRHRTAVTVAVYRKHIAISARWIFSKY